MGPSTWKSRIATVVALVIFGIAASAAYRQAISEVPIHGEVSVDVEAPFRARGEQLTSTNKMWQHHAMVIDRPEPTPVRHAAARHRWDLAPSSSAFGDAVAQANDTVALWVDTNTRPMLRTPSRNAALMPLRSEMHDRTHGRAGRGLSGVRDRLRRVLARAEASGVQRGGLRQHIREAS